MATDVNEFDRALALFGEAATRLESFRWPHMINNDAAKEAAIQLEVAAKSASKAYDDLDPPATAEMRDRYNVVAARVRAWAKRWKIRGHIMGGLRGLPFSVGIWALGHYFGPGIRRRVNPILEQFFGNNW